LSYLAWTVAHPDGFVLNVRRRSDADYVILHRASCRSISNDNQAPGAFLVSRDSPFRPLGAMRFF
jgi:hypothetical protein